MGFGPILGLIRTINWNLMAFSKALKDPYPVDPNGSHGPKFALEGIFVPHIKDVMVVGPAISLIGLRDLLVAQGWAAKMGRKLAGFWAGLKNHFLGRLSCFCIIL